MEETSEINWTGEFLPPAYTAVQSIARFDNIDDSNENDIRV